MSDSFSVSIYSGGNSSWNSFSATGSLDPNTSYNPWGSGPPNGGGTRSTSSQPPRPAPTSPGVADAKTGRVSPGTKVVLMHRWGYRLSATETSAQLLAGLDKVLKSTRKDDKPIAGGYQTPSLVLADGSEVKFADDDALRAYLQRSAQPLASADQVDALYRAVLGRGADTGGVKAAQDALAANGSVQGGSLDEVRRGLASSPEAAARVGDLYRTVLGRAASAAEVAGFQNTLAQGGSLQDVRSVLAHSPEARADVAEAYRRELGREADAGALASAEAALAGGGTPEQVRAGVASSAEAGARAGEIYRAALGREASSGEVAGVQAALAGGGSLAEVRAAVARSPEARARVSGAFEAVLGRAPEGTGWMQDVLARGGSVSEVRAGLAYSDEAAGAIRGAYLQALGRDADAAGVSYWRERLAGGASLAEVRAALASGPEAASRVSSPSVESPAPEAPAPAGAGEVAPAADGTPAVSPVAGFLMPAPAAAEVATAEGAVAWLARNGLRVGTGLGAGAAVLLTPLNAQSVAIEAGVEGHPEWGARVERAPGSRSGNVVLYERGADGQAGRELARLGLDTQERLVSPGAEMGGGAAFGAWDSTSTVRLGADLDAALVALTGAEAASTGSTGAGSEVAPARPGEGATSDGASAAPVQDGTTETAPATGAVVTAGQEQAGQGGAPPSTTPLQTGYSFEIRDDAESAIVAAGQARNKSQQDIQAELDNHRGQQAAGGTGTGGAPGSTGVTPSGDPNQESVIVQLEPGVLEAPGSIGRMKLERTPGLGDKASMSELVQSGAVPGSEGVILIDEVGSPTQLYGDIWQLSQQNGVEYLLTREADKLVLYSGAETTIPLPRNADILAHTHPYDAQSQSPQTMPSLADINALNTIWGLTPDAERPMSDIIWGPDPEHVTTFGATGIDRLSDPTKGGLKPGRAW